MTVYMTVIGPPVVVLMVVWGMDVGPLPITKIENGSGLAPAMGFDGAVWRSSLDLYGSESELEAMCPFDGLEGHREWSQWCWFKDPTYGGSPLRHEEECGGSIVLDFYQIGGNDIWTPVTNGFLLAVGGHLATKTARR